MVDIKDLQTVARGFSILYVEDEAGLRDSIVKYLEKLFGSVHSASNGQEGLEIYKQNKPDIVITDILMPRMTGLEMLGEIKKIDEEQECIIVSAYSESSYFMDSIRLGVNGYIIKPFNYDQMNLVLYKSVTKLSRFQENKLYKENLEILVQKRTEKLIELEHEREENFEHTLLAFVDMIEDRDTYTGGHSLRVATYSEMIAQEMGYPQEKCEMIYRAGILHDIGKIATPDTILLKPGQLNSLEYRLIQEHVKVGYELLKQIPMYKEMAEIIAYHHERYNGKGYPYGLKNEEIPELSRIMIVADSFDAMTTNRIYKGRKSLQEALVELEELSEIQYDPLVVSAAIKVLAKLEEIDTASQLPTTELEQERFSYFYRDQVTAAYNMEYLNFILNRNAFEEQYHFLAIIFTHRFGEYNKQYGWTQGNNFLSSFVDRLQALYPQALVFRLHGDDFVLVAQEQLSVEDAKLTDTLTPQESTLNFTSMSIDLDVHHLTNVDELEALLIHKY